MLPPKPRPCDPAGTSIHLDARLHGAVLARPIARSSLLVLLGVAAMLVPFVAATVVGALLIAAGAFFTLRPSGSGSARISS